MAAVITAPQSIRPGRSARSVPAAPARPALRVLDGGRRAGEPIARSPRPVAARTVSSHPSPSSGVVRPTAAVYRRRRLLAGAAAVVVLATIGLALIGARTVLAGTAASASTAPVGTSVVDGTATAGPVHVVQPGDTLWRIAEDLEPSGDVRALVDELADRAGSGPLQAGQRIPLDGLVP